MDVDANELALFAPAFAAVWLAGLAAALACWHWLSMRGWTERRREASGLDKEWLGGKQAFQAQGVAAAVLRHLLSTDRRLALGAARRWLPDSGQRRAQDKMRELIRYAGLAEQVHPSSVREVRFRLGLLLAAAAGAVGSVLSLELGLLLGAFGLVTGLLLPGWALQQERDARSRALGRELPELLEVMGLGLRSGLSFDRCFALYHQHFSTAFARSCALAQQQWMLGLKTRKQGLRDLAECYDSVLLSRVVQTMIRSLHFGTSLAESLESAAQEARGDYKAKREEQVAKAPVKMMLPTGTLILPAMLLLVLGPVLLELMEGF